MVKHHQPDTRPSLFDLWTHYHFDISLLTSTADIPEATISAMLGNQPVTHADAEMILIRLSALLQKDFTLDTVYVVLEKPMPAESNSEVARLMQQIEAEFQSGMQGLHGLALGTARHEFITKRMENIGGLHEELRALIGDDAMPLIVERLDQLNQEQASS